MLACSSIVFFFSLHVCACIYACTCTWVTCTFWTIAVLHINPQVIFRLLHMIDKHFGLSHGVLLLNSQWYFSTIIFCTHQGCVELFKCFVVLCILKIWEENKWTWLILVIKMCWLRSLALFLAFWDGPHTIYGVCIYF